ncbi:MAG: hydroxymyristoyl-ACP dehydratase [Pseudomonadota bacterium]
MDPHVVDHGPGYSRDRRFFEGHFPGNPIVPGAVLLAQLSADLATQGQRITHVIRMKFVRPLSPDQPFEIELTPAGENWRADFSDAGGPLARAAIKITPLDD